jgi:hypothetical protein
MAVAEWESLTYKLEQIDEYLDRIGQHSFLTKYNHDVLKDKVITGFHKNFRIECTKVHDRPEVLPVYMKCLKKLKYRLEQANQYEKLRMLANTNCNTGGLQLQKQKNGRSVGRSEASPPIRRKKDRPKWKDPAIERSEVSKELCDFHAMASAEKVNTSGGTVQNLVWL